jgi:hypothetical protein
MEFDQPVSGIATVADQELVAPVPEFTSSEHGDDSAEILPRRSLGERELTRTVLIDEEKVLILIAGRLGEVPMTLVGTELKCRQKHRLA